MQVGFEANARLGRLHPAARPSRWGLEVRRDLPWRAPGGRFDRLDVCRPARGGPHPAVPHLHGGAFRILSKDTHWGMAQALAARGYTVFVPNYRLAPRHPYPAAVEDACAAPS